MISSVKNETVKQWQKLKQKKYREQTKKFLIEGFHLVEEAYKSNWSIDTIIIQPDVELPEELRHEKTVVVSDQVMAHITDTKTPQGIAAIVNMSEEKLFNPKKLLILDAIQDPGNLGTMIRTADAAGIDAVVLGSGTVDLFNDKVIRASQGSIFHLPIIRRSLLPYLETLQASSFQVWASTLDKAEPIDRNQVPEKLALIVGNEGQGVQQHIIDTADRRVHIPIYGQAESLNVSIATGIMLYEIVGIQQTTMRKKR